jgi:ribonuclease P protein component
MISGKHRFHGYGSLKYVYQRGQTTRGPLFSIKSVINPKRSNYRLAVVVSKKVHKSAVARNRIRRRIYEAFRLFEPDIAEPYDLVLTVFSDTAESEPIEKIHSQIKKQLQSSDVLVKRVVRQE